MNYYILNFTLHYEAISAKAYRVLGLLRRTITIHSIIAKKKLYLSLIRSQLLFPGVATFFT